MSETQAPPRGAGLPRRARAISLLAVILLVLGPTLAWLEWVDPRIGLSIFQISGLAGLVAMVLAGVCLVRRDDRRLSIRALVLGSIPVLVLGALAVNASRYPVLNDVATDVEDPPEFVEQDVEPVSEEARELVRVHHDDLGGLVVEGEADAVFEAALEVAEAREDWALTRVDEEARVFEGVATSGILKFRDDFVVRVRPLEGGEVVVDMRSASRLGASDLGANAARIRGFFEDVEGAL